jgi:hypothetical protein
MNNITEILLQELLNNDNGSSSNGEYYKIMAMGVLQMVSIIK